MAEAYAKLMKETEGCPDVSSSFEPELLSSEDSETLNSLKRMLSGDVPADVRPYLEAQLKVVEDKDDVLRLKNCQDLAWRVGHKYYKYPERFAPASTFDFYDGSQKIDSAANPVVLEPIFRDCLTNLCRLTPIPLDSLLAGLHVSRHNVNRFHWFIDVALSAEEEDWEDQEEEEDLEESDQDQASQDD